MKQKYLGVSAKKIEAMKQIAQQKRRKMMKLRTENFTFLLTFVIILFAGCSGCGQKTSLQEAQPPNGEGHMHDGVLHPDHPHVNERPKIPSAPESDPFFETIEFPDPPPQKVDGHPPLSKSPSPVPDFVHNNPDHFIVNERGYFDVIYPKEKSKKLEAWRASGDTATDMSKQVEIITEGLDALPAAVVLMQYGGIHREAAKAHFEKALVENPDDFYALLYWAGLIKADNPAEAESIFRRLVEMRPDSFRALYSLGRHIVRTYSDPSEAIPYLEKAYHLAPHYAGPLLDLGIAYTKLGEFEKALKYFEACDVFTGGPSDVSAMYVSSIKKRLSLSKQGANQ